MQFCFYCQHVLGVGHLFRTLSVCRALAPTPVSLILGGRETPARLPENVSLLALPGIFMDSDFSGLFVKEGQDLETVKKTRRQMLLDHFEAIRPAVFVVELFPFGRKAFSFELAPLLSCLRKSLPAPCKVVCSLRDILVEKKDSAGFERRAITHINEWFDALVVHADPSVVTLSETFSRESEIRVPVFYSGYVSPEAPLAARAEIRRSLGLSSSDTLVVAAAGGGSVGGPLLSATVFAYPEFSKKRPGRLMVFTGPYLADPAFADLCKTAGKNVEIRRFTDDFPALLSAADLCVTMAGYNTMANLAAACARALVWPFSQNQEQRMRAERFSRRMPIRILDDSGLAPGTLAISMESLLSEPRPETASIDLSGAEKTAVFLKSLLG